MSISNTNQKHVVVIGGGLGGLSSAIYLALKGIKVTIIEKNSHLGGKLGEIRTEKFRFDTGPSLVTMPSVFDELLVNLEKLKNANLDGHINIDHPALEGEFSRSYEFNNSLLNIIPLETICRYFLPQENSLKPKVVDTFNGTNSDETTSNEKLSFDKTLNNIQEQLGKKAASEFKDFLDYSRRIFSSTASVFLYEPIFDITLKNIWRTIKALPGLRYLDPLRTMQEAINSYISSPELKKILGRYATYTGSSPFLAPATLNNIASVEFGLGSYYIKGGIYSLIKTIENSINDSNIKILKNSTVSKISRCKNKKLLIQYKNSSDNKIKTVACDAVIANSDVTHSYQDLLNIKYKKHVDPKAISSSAIVFFWGMKNRHEKLKHHNILFSKNYKEEFEEIFSLGYISQDPTVYINITSKTDKQDAPEGHENWFTMINAPSLHPEHLKNNNSSSMGSKDKIVNKAREIIFKKLESYDIEFNRNDIVFENVHTPYYYRDNLNSSFGSLYGVSSNFISSAFQRHSVKSRKVKGVFFAGGSVHPGGGMPLVILSGKRAALNAINYLNK